MTETKRLSERQKRRYHTILTVAVELLSKHGLDGVSIREVAEKAEVSAVTLYNVFGSKDDLLSAAVELHNRSFIRAAKMSIRSRGFAGLLEINRWVCESSLQNEALSRSVASMLFRDSSLFGVRAVYWQFHKRFIEEIGEAGDLVETANPSALTYLLMLQNNASLAAWASEEISTENLNAVFDIVACDVIGRSAVGDTLLSINECYADRMRFLERSNFAQFFAKERGFRRGLRIEDLFVD